MIRVRKMLPGETRTYNRADRVDHDRANDSAVLTTDDPDDTVAVVIGDVVLEFERPCRVYYSKPKR